MCAYTVVRRVFEQGAYADRAFASEARALGPRERALAMRLAYGTVQRRATLDYVAERLVKGQLQKLDAPVLAALRLGLLQLLYLDGVAEHAAVNETVELVKGTNQRGTALVNAVLRRGAKEARAILASLDDSDPKGAAVLHSVPRWVAELWWEELGPEEALALMRAQNEPPERVVRLNRRRPGQVEGRLPADDDVRPLARLEEDGMERVVDRVRQDVGAGNRRDAEDDRDRRQRRPQLAS